VPDVDLFIDAIEVTQGIQDLDNSVPLIANKRTYVRAHVRANQGDHPYVLGQFFVIWDFVKDGPYDADNPGGRITVKSDPDRGEVDDSFYFEIPPQMLWPGWIHICLDLNPDKNVPEFDYDNNWACAQVQLTSSPQIKVRIYTVSFQYGPFPSYEASMDHVKALVSWLHRAYPVPSVVWNTHTLYWSQPYVPFDVGCGAVNNELATLHALYVANNSGLPFFDPNWRFYGMVIDAGDMMRGCAAGIPALVASGPTGTGTWGWDTDGSYGDWYGGHELGHAYGRYHAECCGAKGGSPYPYPNCIIGGPVGDTDRFYGWDIELQQVYPPTWTEIMSYCDEQWISDFTYNGLREQLIAEAAETASLANVRSATGEYLAVFGQINLVELTAELGTLYRLQDFPAPEAPTPNEDWSLVLLDGEGEALATYPFTPKNDSGPGDEEYTTASIIETVLWVEGTARIAVQYQGTEVAARDVSAGQPSVEVIYPNGGEALDGDTVTVTWEASDPDEGPLVYALLYSPDGGSSWQTLAVSLTDTEHTVSLDELPGSDEALFRVIASDGVNTGQDESDGAFQVIRKAPQAWITSPGGGTRFTPGQQVMLVGEGYDTEDGLLPDEGLRWSSDVNGELGTGKELSITGLDTGWHVITLEAVDSDEQSASDTAGIYVGTQPYMVYLPIVMKY